MTLDEAIKHGEAIATEYEYEIKEFLAVDDEENAGKCIECRDNHVQLLEWLKELKYYRNEFEKLKKKTVNQQSSGFIN